MRTGRKITATTGLFLALAASFSAVASPPPLPSSFFGTLTGDGVEIPAGTLVSAWTGTTKLAEAPVFQNGSTVSYRLDVPGDIPSTSAIEGAVPGQALTLKVGGATATPQGATWQTGTYSRHDLTVGAGPDIAVLVNDDVTGVFPGERVTYTLNVRNNGPETATGIALRDTLPQMTSLVSAGGGVLLDGVVTWPAFNLAPGASTTRTLTLDVSTVVIVGTESITNTATAFHDGNDGLDPNPADNTAADTDTLRVPPDFAVGPNDLTLSPAQPAAGSTVSVNLAVRNIGFVSGTTLVAFYDGGTLIGTRTATVAASGSATVTASFVAGPSTVLVSAVVDPDNDVIEISESNNLVRKFLAEVPDLAVGIDNILLDPRAPRAGDPVEVEVTVRNAGRVAASNVAVELWDGEPDFGGTRIASGQIPSLLPGGNRALTFPWTAAQGPHRLTVVVDSANAVLELSEDNNRAFRDLVIPRSAGPDLTVGSVDVSGLQQSQADLVADGMVTAVVSNTGDATASAPYAVRLFEDRDGDGSFSKGDRELARQSMPAGLAAGASAPTVLSVHGTLEFHRPVLWIEADADEEIDELREDNNLASCFGSCELGAPASLEPVEEEWFLPGMEVETAPLVVQLSDDNGDGIVDSRDIPDVVFHMEDSMGSAVTARSGAGGSEVWTFRATQTHPVLGRLANLAAADLDGDGVVEVLAGMANGRFVALSHKGHPLWVSDPVEGVGGGWNGAASIADLTGDGVPEIVVGRTVLSNTGRFLAKGTSNVAQNYNWFGPMGVPTAPGLTAHLSVVADIDLDGRPEIVAGDAVYRMENGLLVTVWDFEVEDHLMDDGYSAVANLDGDPQAEIVYTSSGFVMTFEHNGAVRSTWRRYIPILFFDPERNTFWGGPPTIADLDGNGSPEILLAADTELVALRADLSVLWRKGIDERASHTSATVFDLDADNFAEVIYLDQSKLWILDGRTGQTRHSRTNLSKTAIEYPVVADVDNDGQAEILVPSNRSFGGDASTQGLHVLGSPGWRGTRPIWNQHSYHVTNIQLDGTVPASEVPSWQAENTFRANEKGERRVKLQPNATISVPRVAAATSTGAPIRLRVGNGGRGVLPSGVAITLYAGNPSAGVIAGEGATSVPLRPGEWEDVTVVWQQPGPAGAPATAVVDSRGRVAECDESDNAVAFAVTETVLPDLVVPTGGVTVSAPARAGQRLTVTVKVENRGSAVAAAGKVRLFLGPPSLGEAAGEADLPSLAPGKSATVTIAWDTLGLAGSHLLHALADADEDVFETDESNNVGTAEVTLAAATRPDPAAESLGIVPSSTTVGTPVLLTSEVVNRGTALANGFVLAFRVNNAEVGRVTSSDPMEPGARRTVEHVLSTLTLSGRVQVEARVDPSNAIAEENENNNTQTGWLDLASTGLTAAVRTDRISYKSNETASLTATAQNGGAAREVVLRVTIQNAAGAVIAPISEQTLTLAAGTTTFPFTWPTGATPAGTYAAVAELELQGTVVARGSSPFSILGDRSASAQLFSDREEYDPRDSVTLTGRVRNTGVNQALTNLQARLVVTSPAGTAVFTSSRAIPALEPGAEEQVDGVWSIDNAPPGVYTAKLELRENAGHGGLLAFASVPVKVLDSGETGSGLSGELEVSPDPVGSGAPLLARFSASNGGNAAMPGLRLRVRLIRMSDEAVVASQELPWPLLRNEQRAGSAAFDTLGFAEGEHRAVLEGLLPGGERTLASAPFQAVRGVSVADATVAEGDAGTAQALFEVTLSSAAPVDVMVDYHTADGTAVAGEDYDTASGTLTFAAGETSKTVAVAVHGDTKAEAEEVFLLELESATGVALGDAQALGVIADEEGCPSPNLLANGGAEQGSTDSDLPGWTATGEWRRRYADPVTLDGLASFAAGGAGDRAELSQDVDLSPYAARIDGAGQELVFEAFVQSKDEATPDAAQVIIEYRDAANQTVLGSFDSGEVASAGTWRAVGDARAVPAGTRWARVRLVGLRRSEAGIDVYFDRMGLRSLGVPTLTAEDVTVTEGNSGTVPAAFELRLACPAAAPVEVGYATADGTARAGTDFDAASGTATFPAGATARTVNVAVRGDLIDEQDESFSLDLTSGPDEVVLRPRLSGHIEDDDGPVTVSAADAFVDEGDGGTAEVQITVTLSAPSGKTVKVNYTTVPGTATAPADFAPVSGTLTFVPGDESLTVTAEVAGDLLDELDETFALRLSAPVNAALGDAEGTVTILDHDDAALSIGDLAVLEGHGEVVDAVFPVTLSLKSDREVRVNYATVNGTAVAGTDYQAASGTLVLAPGTTTATVNVRILGNRTEQLDRAFRVLLDAPQEAALLDPEAEATIRDDDGVLISIGDAVYGETDSGAADYFIPVSVTNNQAKTVTVNYALIDGTAKAGTDFVAASGTLTFPQGVGLQQVKVSIVGDLLEETLTETFQVRLSNQNTGTLQRGVSTITVTDNDGWVLNAAANVTSFPGCVFLASGFWTSGTAWRKLPLDLSRSFDQTYQVYAGSSDGGADGMTFTLQRAGLNAVGGGGGGLAYAGISPSVGVEIDTWHNGGSDLGEDHLGVNLNGSLEHNGYPAIQASATSADVEDDKRHDLRVVWNATTKQLDVHFDGSERLMMDRDIVAQIFGGNPSAYYGFTAATGGASNVHYFCPTVQCFDAAQPTRVSVGDVRLQEGDSGTVSAVFPVTLSCPSDQAVRVSFRTENGTAEAGSDYQAATGTVTFAPGETAKDVVVQAIGDVVVEANETFRLALSSPLNAEVRHAEGTATILDEDSSMTLPYTRLAEGNTGGWITTPYFLRLSRPLNVPVSFNWTLADDTATAGSDYQAKSGTITFPPGDTMQEIQIAVFGDASPEPDETIRVNLSNASAAFLPASLTLTIVDDEECLGGNLIRNGGADEPLVNGQIPGWTTVAGSWSVYTGFPHQGPHYFWAGHNAVSELIQDVDLSGFAPHVAAARMRVQFEAFMHSHAPENPLDTPRFILEFRNASKSQILGSFDSTELETRGEYRRFADIFQVPVGTAWVRIRLISTRYTCCDNNAHFDTLSLRSYGIPDARVEDISTQEGSSGSGKVSFPVKLQCAAPFPVWIDFVTADGTAKAGSDYQSAFGTLTFAPGEVQKLAEVQVLGDTVTEGNETFFLNLVSVDAGVSRPQAVATILDDETSVAIEDRTLPEGNSGLTDFSFNVRLGKAIDQIATVDWFTSDSSALTGSDYVAAQGTVTFQPGETLKTVTIKVVGDTVTEPDEKFKVNLTNPLNVILGDNQADGVIQHDDLGLSVADVAVIEGNTGTVNALFQVRLSAASTATVTVDYRVVPGTAAVDADYTAVAPGRLTFAAGQTSQTVTVPVRGDVAAEPSETLFLQLSNPVNAAIADDEAMGVIADDDGCPGPNLLANAGGEEPLVAGKIPGWTEVSGFAWTYSNFQGTYAGANFMYAGAVAAAELRQDVDLTPYAAFIDAGIQRFSFEGYVRSADTPPDPARVVLEYLDANKVLLGSFDSGEIVNIGPWSQVADLRLAPQGTRWARVRLITRRISAGNADAYFDGFSLRSLDTPVLSVADKVIFEGDSEPLDAEMALQLTCSSVRSISVDYTTTDGTAVAPADYETTSGTATYPVGNTLKVVKVPVQGDFLNEIRETFRFQLSNPVNVVVLDPEAVVTVRDADPGKPPVVGDDRTYTLDAELELASLVALHHDAPANNQLQVGSQGGTFPFIWIALSNRGTIVKIDTESGQILGEYATAPNVNGQRRNSDSSRTTVTLDGSAWVGNRNDGSVAHVGLPELGQCIDRNGNGAIDTSAGYGDILPWTNAGNVDERGGVTTAQDECILHYVKTSAFKVRHLSVDADNDLWVSGWENVNSSVFNQIDTDTGQILRTTQQFPCGGYGGFIDGNGILWSSGGLLRFDTKVWPPTSTSWRCIGGMEPYGLAVDNNGWVFVSAYYGNRVWKVSPEGTTILGPYGHGTWTSQGLAVDSKGDVWVSSGWVEGQPRIGHLKNDGFFLGTVEGVPVGSSGVAIDSKQRVWTANYSSGTASRIDPTKGPIGADGKTPIGQVDLVVQLPGATPYNYSDMTGYQAFRSTVQQGRWELIQDAGYANAKWGTLEWNHEAEGSIPPGASIVAEVRAAASIPGLGAQSYIPVANGVPFELTGRFLQVRVTLRRNADKVSPVLSDIRVRVLEDAVVAVADAQVVEGNGGTTNAVFTVQLAGPVNQEVRVAFATADGTAAAGEDYTAVSGTVVFPIGSTEQTVAVPVLGDLRAEPDETFFLNLSAPVHATLADPQGQGTIVNDDAPPVLAAVKTAALQVDGSTQGEANPGDVLRYEVTVSNTGQGPAAGVVFEDPIPANTTLVEGSVVASGGTVESLSPLRVLIGDLAAGSSATVRFDARIATPFPDGVEQIANQGEVRSSEIAPVLTDDPSQPGTADPTVTPVAAGPPVLAALKRDELASDADGDGVPSPGDRLRYEVTLTNSGPTPATEVVFQDLPPMHTSIVADSVTSSAGTIESQSPVRVAIDDLAPGASVTIRFEVVVDNPVPKGVTEISNQGTLSSRELPPVPTDDPDLGGETDPTVSPITAAPKLVAEKTAELAVDADLDQAPSPGDTLAYKVTVRNVGNTSATGVSLTDPVPADAALEGSPSASQGTVSVEAGEIRADLGEIAGGAHATVGFRVKIADPIPARVREISNQGEVTSTELPRVKTDDPAIGGTADPTVTHIAAAPALVVEKTASLFEDADGDGLASPGDVLLYRITLENRGNTAATEVRLSDEIPAGTAYLAGSLQTSQGTIVTEQPVVVDLGEIAADAQANVAFKVTVDAGFPATSTDVANQASVTAHEMTEAVPSDDPSTAELGDPTSTAIFITPEISIADVTVVEGAGTAELTVSLSRPGNREAQVTFAMADGSALAGADFTAGTGTLTFAPGETEKTVTVAITDDLLDEADEGFRVMLSGPVQSKLADAEAAVTIMDDDAPPSIVIGEVSVQEGHSGTTNAGLTVTLSAPSGLEVRVDYATADGTAAGADYTPAAGTLVFPAGTLSQTVNVAVTGETLFEADETVLVNLANPLNAVLPGPQALVTVVNDDQPPSMSISDLTVGEGSPAELTLALSEASGLDATVTFTTADGTAQAGSDYTAAGGSVTIPAGSLTGKVIVQTLGDLLDEADEGFKVLLSAPVQSTLADAEAAVTIVDDDAPPSIAIADVSVQEGHSGTANAGLTVTLSEPSGLEVRVEYSTADGTATGSDYTAATGTLVFPAGTTSRTIEVAVTGETLFEADETVLVNLANPLSATLPDPQALVTVINDDQPPSVSISDVTVTEGDTGTTPAELTMTLSAASGLDATVTFATADGTAQAGSDYTAAGGTVTIPAGSLTGTVAVQVAGDEMDEHDEFFQVLLSAPAAATLADTESTVTITDDDEVVSLSIGDVTVEEGHSGTTDAVFRVRLSTSSASEVRVEYATSADTATQGTDYQEASGTLTFPAGETERSVTVKVVGDLLFEGDETFTVNLSNPVAATIEDGEGLGTITNDELCPSPNLLANPGAEARPVNGEIPGWTEVQGTSWQRRAAPPAPYQGTYSFSAGTPQFAELRQDVNVSGYAGRIDAGSQKFAFSAWALSLTEVPPDVTQVIVEYRNAANTVALDTFDSGEIANTSGWATVSDVRTVPAGTRWVRVRLLATRFAGTTSDALFDALSLTSLGSAAVTVSDAAVYEGDSGTRNAVFQVRLSCALDQAIALGYSTANGTAVAGSDYVATSGTLTLPAGTAHGQIPVPVVGDLVDEPHEAFFLNLTLMNPARAALTDPQAQGNILEDDFCQRSPGYWKTHRSAWAVEELQLGGVWYNDTQILSFLGYNGSDAATRLAHHLSATKLNLARGSEPSIVHMVEQAEAFLAAYPPGSNPKGALLDQANSIKNALDAYNNACP